MSASSMLFKVISFYGQGESRASETMNPLGWEWPLLVLTCVGRRGVCEAHSSGQTVCASAGFIPRSWGSSKGRKPFNYSFFFHPSRSLSENMAAMMLLTWLIFIEPLLCPE